MIEIIGRVVSLKRAGRNYKGLCPFHNEKTPSFNVNPDRQSYYCFGCQEGGDVFSFLMKMEGLSFVEAARSLARSCGVELPESSGEGARSESLFDANTLLAGLYRAELARGDNPGAAYLRERGLDAETIERFGIGFVPDRWDFAVQALRGKGISAEIGERAGLLAPRSSGGHYDRLRGRVLFPIQDRQGRVIGFGGRAIGAEQEPKYLNTPESPIFHKREALYGFPHALEPMRRNDRAIVVEGYFDCIALHRAGLGEAVATCGTSLTSDHARNLRRRTRNVVLFFDGDDAGQRAVERALDTLLPEGLRVRAALLAPGDDPDIFLAREGGDALRALVDGARSAVDVVIDRAVAGDTNTPWAKADAVASVAPLLARVASAVERSEYCNQLALAVGSESRHVEAAVHAAARGEDARDAMPVAPRRSGPEDRNLRQLAQSLVEHPILGRRVPSDELRTLVPDGPFSELIGVLVAAAAEDRAVDLEEVANRLEDEARTLLRALSVHEDGLDEETATRTVDDTLSWLRKQQIKRQKRALTQKLREPNADADAVLKEKQQLISKQNQVAPSREGAPL